MRGVVGGWEERKHRREGGRKRGDGTREIDRGREARERREENRTEGGDGELEMKGEQEEESMSGRERRRMGEKKG